MKYLALLTISSVGLPAQADWHFRRRPDFNVPRLNVTKGVSGAEQGYLFVATWSDQL